MLVFKTRSKGESNYSLPDKYKSGGSAYDDVYREIDCYHVGIVISASPLKIYHCGSNPIRVDTAIGKWSYCGWLKIIGDE